MPMETEFDAAWRSAHRAVEAVLQTWARGASPADREDLLQVVRIRAWRAFADYDRSRPFSGWVCRIAQRICLDRVRDLSRRPAIVDVEQDEARPLFESLPDPSGSPLDALMAGEVGSELRSLIETLSDRSRQIVLMIAAGWSCAEISAALNMPIGSVRSTLWRARKTIAEMRRRSSPVLAA